MVLGVHSVLRVTEPYFLKIIFLLQKWRKWAKNELKIRFFKFIAKFSHYFL